MNQIRTEGQKLIPFPVRPEFLKALDSGMRELGFVNRSQFIRDAVFEKLVKGGAKLHLGLSQAPSRMGKGGRPARRARD